MGERASNSSLFIVDCSRLPRMFAALRFLLEVSGMCGRLRGIQEKRDAAMSGELHLVSVWMRWTGVGYVREAYK